jgi:4,5-dihydroxyphthalate decarboxylase
MQQLKLSFISGRYNHTRPLMDGTIRPEGIELVPQQSIPADTFPRLFRDRAFQVAEMGMSIYLGTLATDDPPFIAIPVFLSRSFRHAAIFINKNSGIRGPLDLPHKKLGEAFFFGHDAGTWARAALTDEYGLAPTNGSTFYIGGVERPERPWDWLPFQPPANVTVHHIGAQRTLDEMLENGEIDALYTANIPPSFLKGSSNIRRLFENSEPLEREYFRRTGIFPIMHTVGIRRDVYRDHPWIARSLYQAFVQAKEQVDSVYRSNQTGLHRVFMFPWLTELYERNKALMGDDPWPYGVEANRRTLEAFCRHHYEQGLSTRRLAPEQLFAPETLDVK